MLLLHCSFLTSEFTFEMYTIQVTSLLLFFITLCQTHAQSLFDIDEEDIGVNWVVSNRSNSGTYINVHQKSLQGKLLLDSLAYRLKDEGRLYELMSFNFRNEDNELEKIEISLKNYGEDWKPWRYFSFKKENGVEIRIQSEWDDELSELIFVRRRETEIDEVNRTTVYKNFVFDNGQWNLRSVFTYKTDERDRLIYSDRKEPGDGNDDDLMLINEVEKIYDDGLLVEVQGFTLE